MTASLPVWSTTKAILAYAWGKRALAVRYALPPVGALFLVDLAGIAVGIDIEKNPTWQIVTVLLALLAYAPFTVTWFHSIVRGEADARTRPIFTYTRLEKNVVLANIRVTAAVLIVTVLIAAIEAVALYAIFKIASVSVMTSLPIFVAPGIFFWVMAITRLSVAIAYSAAEEPITLRQTFQLTRSMSFRMTWVHIILATLAFAIVGLTAAATSILNIEKGTGVSIALSVVNAAGGFVYLVLVTTLFGFVYRRLKELAADGSYF